MCFSVLFVCGIRKARVSVIAGVCYGGVIDLEGIVLHGSKGLPEREGHEKKRVSGAKERIRGQGEEIARKRNDC